MRLPKRLISLALALVFCVSIAVLPINASAKKAEYNEPFVRVGMYVDAPTLDTRRFYSENISASGFDIGYMNGDEFVKLFSTDEKNIILVPQVNIKYENGKAYADENGNIGAYSAVLGSFSSYSSAYNAAKSKNGFVAVVKGGYEARAYSANSASAVKSASGGRTVSSPAANGITVLDKSGKILFSFEDSSRKLALRGKNGASVNLPMRHRSGNINHYDYSGIFEYSVTDNLLTMSNILGLELYTKCVMSVEIGTNFAVETRKAFAVLARTVPLYAKHKKLGFDVCTNSACCQVYSGLYRMSEENNAIVDATRGLIATYNNAPIMVLYHNSNGGASCSSVAAWGGEEIPYLTTVFQPEHEDGDKWTKTYTKSEFYKYITSRKSFSAIKD
ncbi:MAG: SpoIID/LytB domain-containing protein, partial [Clostridia bacterium]|nr:SpoIID/LytB domain-containing protein [Clostridia bacterium]